MQELIRSPLKELVEEKPPKTFNAFKVGPVLIIYYQCKPCYNHPMSKTNPLEFLKQVRLELQKVNWPSHQQTLKLTFIVILVSLMVGLYVSGLDVLFTKFIQSIITQKP